MLTTATVRELKPREKMYEVTCAAMPGFVVRVLPTGKKVFLVRQQIDGQWRREKIGLMGPSFGVDEARRRAVLMMGVGERVTLSKSRSPSGHDVIGDVLAVVDRRPGL